MTKQRQGTLIQILGWGMSRDIDRLSCGKLLSAILSCHQECDKGEIATINRTIVHSYEVKILYQEELYIISPLLLHLQMLFKKQQQLNVNFGLMVQGSLQSSCFEWFNAKAD